jgi:hypothetical protein
MSIFNPLSLKQHQDLRKAVYHISFVYFIIFQTIFLSLCALYGIIHKQVLGNNVSWSQYKPDTVIVTLFHATDRMRIADF